MAGIREPPIGLSCPTHQGMSGAKKLHYSSYYQEKVLTLQTAIYKRRISMIAQRLPEGVTLLEKSEQATTNTLTKPTSFGKLPMEGSSII